MFKTYHDHAVWRQEVQFYLNPALSEYRFAGLAEHFERNLGMISLFANLEFLPLLETDQKPTIEKDTRNVIGWLPQSEIDAMMARFTHYNPDVEAWANAHFDEEIGITDCNIMFNSRVCSGAGIVELRKKCLHELTHCLGFDHTDEQDSIMTAIQGKAFDAGLLTRTDILGYHALYPKGDRPVAHICANEQLTFYVPSIEYNGREIWAELKHVFVRGTGKHELRLRSFGEAKDGADFIEKAHYRIENGQGIVRMQDVYWFGMVVPELVFRVLPGDVLELIE